MPIRRPAPRSAKVAALRSALDEPAQLPAEAVEEVSSARLWRVLVRSFDESGGAWKAGAFAARPYSMCLLIHPAAGCLPWLSERAKLPDASPLDLSKNSKSVYFPERLRAPLSTVVFPAFGVALVTWNSCSAGDSTTVIPSAVFHGPSASVSPSSPLPVESL